MKKLLLLISVFSFLSVNAANDATILKGKKAAEKIPNSEIVRLKDFTSIPNYVKFKKGKELPLIKLESWLRSYYKSDAQFGLELIKKENDQSGYTHYRYQQTVDGIPVKFGIYIAHVKNGLIESINGELFDNVSVATNATLTESAALSSALNHINAESYKWEIAAEEEQLKYQLEDPTATYYPKGELILINNNSNIKDVMVLAYRFNIYSQKPFGRKEVYVNAQNGAIVWEENKIHEADVTGTANTLYSGTKTITSDNSSGPFRLRETGRGNGIRTFSNGNTTTYSTADITNGSANWTTPDAALDAHWGAEMTYDYFMNEHSRNSIDGNGFTLISHVHHDQNFSNAFWDGQRMTYGDGSGNNAPLTSIDIAGHEITHGLTSNTANLIYQAESGALNESFSDIFGNSIEIVARPSQNSWELGEDLNFVIRDMANPNAQGDPDTYFGNNWASLTGGDNGGVHTNSGVQNFWYVLLTDGGSGTNDNGDSYTVNALGLTDAGRIAFRNLTVYLTPSSNYSDARFFGIQSAVDLFGGCTAEVESTTNAWYAVGVGGIYSPVTVSDFAAPIFTSCSAPFTVNFNNLSVNGSTFIWDFGDASPTSTQNSPSHTYLTNGNYTVQLIADGGAACGMDTEIKVSYIVVDPALPCVTILPPNGTVSTQTSCIGTIYDSGGAAGNYGSNEDAEITITPLGAATIDLTFVTFDIEAGQSGSCNFDYVEVYDGPNTSSALIDRYCNNNIPTTVSSTSGSITIVFHSDGGVEDGGFQIDWQCQFPAQAPTVNFTVDVDTTCTGIVNFTDLSTNGPSAWAWDFGDGNNSSQQNPGHTYTSNGLYTVELTATNGFGPGTLIQSGLVFVNMPAAPSTVDDLVCENNTANLTATGSGTLNWYNNATGGSIINTGTSYTTPSLATTTIYYVENVIASPIVNGAKPNNTGGGANFNSLQHLIFDVYTPMEIIDVEVVSGAVGNRTIELRNSAGAVLQTTTVNIPNGTNTVTLNFTVMPGTDYQLGVSGTSAIDLYRNNASVNYPYSIGGLGDVTHSSAGQNGGLDHYYFFYNWNVKEPDCVSSREPVTANVQICTGLDEVNGNSEITSFLNAANYLELGLTNLTQGKYNLVVLNALGQVVVTNQINVNSAQQSETVNMQSVAKGLYYVKLYNAESSYTVKLVK